MSSNENELPTITAELMLVQWSETATAGAKLVFEVSREDLEKFKSMTTRDGKKPGQRLAAAFVHIGDDEQPVKGPRPRIGPLCDLAVRWCREATFQEWLADHFPNFTHIGPSPELSAAGTLREILNVRSRREIDDDPIAAQFTTLIRVPYTQHMKERNGQGT